MAGPGRILRPTSGGNAPRNMNTSGRGNQPFRYVRPMGPANSRPGAFAISIQQYLYVYDTDGTLRWTVDLRRHTDGDYQQVCGLCFDINQGVWIGWIDYFYAVGDIPAYHTGYLFHYDRNGNFLEERSADLVGSNLQRSLVASPSGMTLLTEWNATTTAGRTLDGVTFELSGTSVGDQSCLCFDDDDNVYVIGYTVATGRAFFKWSSSGTLLSVVASSYAFGGLAVAPDGSYGYAYYNLGFSGGAYHTRFNKVNLSTGALISFTEPSTEAVVRSARIAPWGELLYAGNDVDASQIRGHKLMAEGLVLESGNYTSGRFTYDDAQIWEGVDYATSVNCVATSIT